MSARCRLIAAVVLALGGGGPAYAADTAVPLGRVADLPLPGTTSRFDYQAYDPSRHLLFIAHLGDSTVTVVDTRSQAVVANVSGLDHVHGLVAIPELGRVYATATGAHRVAAIDEERFRIVGSAPAGRYPDGLAYAPPAHKLYVSDKTGNAVVVIDVRSNRQVTTIGLGGEIGNTRYDPVSGHVFTNVQGRRELAEIDPATDRVLARHPLPDARGNHGLLIAPSERLAFIACEDNARLLVLDLRSMAVVASYPVGAQPDVLALDPGVGRLYVASESGVLSVFKVVGGEVRKLGEGPLAATAHSVAVAPETHRVYLPIQEVGGRPVLRVMEPAP